MNVITSFCIAIAMYSRIPMVKMEWSKERMKYSLAFFPFVGVIIAAVEILWYILSEKLFFSQNFYAAGATVIPIIITGGIHLDGYCDTIDALSSFQSREKRLAILKDSNSGAFAIIWMAVYSIIYFGACSQITSLKMVIQMSVGYIISRALSGIAAVNFNCANKNGLLAAFSTVSAKKIVQTTLMLISILCAAVEIYMSIYIGIAVIICVSVFYYYYYYKSLKEFGGITGDLAGWFTVKCEILILLVTVIVTSVINLN